MKPHNPRYYEGCVVHGKNPLAQVASMINRRERRWRTPWLKPFLVYTFILHKIF